MRAPTFGLLIALLPAFGAIAAENADIRRAATAFYGAYLKLRPSGIPDAKQQKALGPHFTPALRRLLRGAHLAEEKYAERTKREVPPLVEGDIFTSLFEGAERFTVLSCEDRGTTGSCLVEFFRADPNGKAPAKWQDRVHLVSGAQGWRIDDVEYRGDWEFMHKGRLKDLLRATIRDAAK